MGRHRKYSEDSVEIINNLLGQGFSIDMVSKKTGMSLSTIYRFKKLGRITESALHKGGQTWVPDDYHLPDLRDNQRMDGTPAFEDAMMDFVTLKTGPEKQKPVDLMQSSVTARKMNVISGRYYKLQIEDNKAILKTSVRSGSMDIHTAHDLLEAMIDELFEMNKVLDRMEG